jgi:hypothetical protein
MWAGKRPWERGVRGGRGRCTKVFGLYIDNFEEEGVPVWSGAVGTRRGCCVVHRGLCTHVSWPFRACLFHTLSITDQHAEDASVDCSYSIYKAPRDYAQAS